MFGIRGRFEAALTPNISVHFSIQNEAVFDTTVNGGLAFHLGGARAGPVCDDTDLRSVEERLGQRVVRDVNIVIAQQTVFQQEAFTLVEETPSATVSSSGNPPPGSGG